MMMSHLEFENADALGSWASQAVEYAKPLLMDADPALLSALPFNLSPALHAESDHLASGDVVVADKQAIGWLHTRDRNIVAVEMETAGVLRSVTARDRPLASLVLRGISDSSEFSKEQSDRVKKGVLRTIAMHRACALLRLLLELDLIPRQQVQS